MRIEVRAGTVLTVDVLRWNEGWEFDCPVCVLRPVVRFSPNGDAADQIVENLCIDASIDGYMESEPLEAGLIDRLYPFKALKRRWSAARGGKHFPVKSYMASRFRVRFYDDADGLGFDAVAVPAGRSPAGRSRAPARCRAYHADVDARLGCAPCRAYYDYWLKRADDVCACSHPRREHGFFTGGCDTCGGYKHAGSPDRCRRFKSGRSQDIKGGITR